MLRIGILTDQFTSWGGGVDFIRLILNGLHSINEKGQNEIDISIYIPNQAVKRIKVINAIKSVLNTFFKKKYQLQKIISKKSIENSLKGVNENFNFYYYDNSELNLANLAVQHHIDVVLPSFKPLSSSFPIPWVGYIYDFQHKYYHEFFTEQEIDRRNAEFALMLEQAQTIIVNAKAVRDDIDKFIGVTNARIVTLPFCPVLNLDFFKNEIDLTQYNLPKQYFMISNQFWKHKDHVTAFKALRLFLDRVGEKEVCLVCTGQTHDERFPDYFDFLQDLILELNLTDKVRILGYIPKNDQLQILKNCVAVIQPTLFEGGPGGGAVYESVAYGIRSIVSDIPVNKELNDETVFFFKTGSPEDLTDKMVEIFNTERHEYSVEYLVQKNRELLLKMGEQILNTIPESN
jgi:glycosyltransferase involved in cell wall biosynthesis